jgi:hypothetical protein
MTLARPGRLGTCRRSPAAVTFVTSDESCRARVRDHRDHRRSVRGARILVEDRKFRQSARTGPMMLELPSLTPRAIRWFRRANTGIAQGLCVSHQSDAMRRPC